MRKTDGKKQNLPDYLRPTNQWTGLIRPNQLNLYTIKSSYKSTNEENDISMETNQ